MFESIRFRASVSIVVLTAATGALVFIATRSTVFEIVAAALVAGALGALGITLLMRPLIQMAGVARTIASGNLRARVSPRPMGELGQLADAFNQMAQSIESLVETSSQERNRLMAALNSSTDPVLAVDAGGVIRFANAAAGTFLSPGRAGLVGSALAWVMPNQEVVEALAASRAGSGREIRTLERPGRQHLQVIVTPIVGGGDWSALVVLHDISDVKRVDQVRRDFVANVSHELRTPLASVKAVLETLEGGALDDPRTASEFIVRADQEIDRLVLLVEELLELSRIESGDLPLLHSPVDLAEVLANAVHRVRPLAEKLEVDLQLEPHEPLPTIEGDSALLERAALNLIQNALKFTPAGGSVTVTVASDESQVHVSVKDTGVGIEASDLPRVFERFYKADHSRGSSGTGLGLAVVKHTVEAHGGSVRVESRPGHGSNFTLSLPVASASLAKASPRGDDSPDVPGGGAH